MTEPRTRGPRRLGRSRARVLANYAQQPNGIEEDRPEERLLLRLVGIKAIQDACRHARNVDADPACRRQR